MQPLLIVCFLGLKSMSFLGFRKSTPELYRNFDVFVSSSRSEVCRWHS